jgi:thiol-disulfide isomerase/thioredoxin
MKPIFLTAIIVCVATFLAYHYRSELQIAAPIESFLHGQPKQDFAWPPQLNEPYPDLHLVDQTGTAVRLSDFKGKIILVELIGIPCPACQAFSGGHKVGGFKGVAPQPDLASIEESARKYGRFDLSNERIVKVHVLLYSMSMRAPTPRDAKAWADHFGLDRSKNEIVLAGLSSMISEETYQMIPGTQLIDQEFILRVDSTGRSARKHDLYRVLLPHVRKLLRRS